MIALKPASPDPRAHLSLLNLIDRILLGGLVALLVARCLIAGDDSGRLRLTSGYGPLVLNALTFALLLAWGSGFVCSKRPLTSGFALWIVLGLVAIAALSFASAVSPDRYARPGWFIGWDWLAVAATCFLCWQLATTDARSQGLTTVLIATAACLAAQALYQGADAILLSSPENSQAFSGSLPLVGDQEFVSPIQTTSAKNSFRATISTPGELAIFLFLLLPATTAGVIRGGKGRTVLRASIAAVVAGAFGIASIIAMTSPSNPAAATWYIVSRYPFLGCGPGNLAQIAEGHAPAVFHFADTAMAFAATTGLPALLIGMAVSLAPLVAGLRLTRLSQATGASSGKRLNQTFVLGGVCGLLTGAALAMADLPVEASGNEILRLGFLSAGRCLIWLLTFQMFAIGALSAARYRLALLLGAASSIVALCFSPMVVGQTFVQTFWIVLILGVAKERLSAGSPPARSLAFVAVSLAVALLSANLIHVGIPGMTTTAAVRSARAASKEFPTIHWKTAGKSSFDPSYDLANEYLQVNMIDPLRRALATDPDNSALLLELARWRRWQWGYALKRNEKQVARHEALEMLSWAEKASRLDPHSLAARRSVFESLLLFTGANATASKEQLGSLEKYIGLIVERDPAIEVSLRYRVVLALMPHRNREALDAWSVHLLQLDGQPESNHGRLSDEQRDRLRHGLGQSLPQPSAELSKLLRDMP